MDPKFEKNLTNYFAARAKARDEEFEGIYNQFTEVEKRLVREAAVMGFVQGLQAAGKHDLKPFPNDSEITKAVVLEAANIPDLYPIMGWYGGHRPEEDAQNEDSDVEENAE